MVRLGGGFRVGCVVGVLVAMSGDLGAKAAQGSLEPGTATVRGALDKEVIRRVIVRHLDEVRACYEGALVEKPTLAGRVTVRFTIAGTGLVTRSEVQSSTVNDDPVEKCVLAAVRGWEFPKPKGAGEVVVAYPFTLKPAVAEEPTIKVDWTGRGTSKLEGKEAPHGSLDKEVIRAVIRAHLVEAQRCYEAALVRRPAHAGRVMIQFTISGVGKVIAARVESSTLKSLPTEVCIADVVKGWEFPKPEGGGIVVVSYPFVFKPARGVRPTVEAGR